MNKKQEKLAVQALQLLGFQVKDVITGLEGVVTSVSFDLYGCVQAIITPKAKDGETKSSFWMDLSRIVKAGDARVMNVPDFQLATPPDKDFPVGHTGGAHKPLPN